METPSLNRLTHATTIPNTFLRVLPHWTTALPLSPGDVSISFYQALTTGLCGRCLLAQNPAWPIACSGTHQAIVSATLSAPASTDNSVQNFAINAHTRQATKNFTFEASSRIGRRACRFLFSGANVTDQQLRCILYGSYGPQLAAAASVG